MRANWLGGWTAAIVLLAVANSCPADVHFKADFETGDLSQWRNTGTRGQNDTSRNVQVVTDIVQAGKYAVKVTIHPDDVFNRRQLRAQLGGPRVEVQEGSDTFMSFYLYMAEAPKSRDNFFYWEGNPPPRYRNVMTWWVEPSAGGTLIKYGTGNLGRDGTHWQADFEIGKWHQLAMHIHWSEDPERGNVRLWFDGELALDKHVTTKGPEAVYFCQPGIHRSPHASPVDSIYFDSFVLADTLEEVLPQDGPAPAGAATPAVRGDSGAALNWPQWRGPLGTGVVLAGNPPLHWSEEKNVKWKVPIPGQGHGTPVVWGQRIFLPAAVPTGDGESLAFTVFCVDKQSGRTVWRKVARVDQPHQDIQPTNSHSSASPVTDGEHLVVSFGSFGLYCYDLDGNLLWEKDLGKVDVTWGEGSSPALVDNTVVVLQDNNGTSFVYGFDVATGEPLWKKRRDEGSSWTTPFVLKRDGLSEVIINGATAVRSYDPVGGEVLWQCSGLGINVTPMVVVDEDTVYAMSGQRTSPRALAIRWPATGDLTGTEAVRWELSRGTPYVSSPLLYEGRLYFVQHVTSVFSCLDARTGKPHFFQERLPGISSVYASLLGAAGRVYVVGREGTTLVLENGDELRILARNELNDGCDASPVVVGDELFLRSHGHLYCITEG